jgi:hypothetical protein
MANVVNPITIGWQHSGKNTDTTPFDATQYAGTELSFDGKAAVSIPVTFATNGQYQIALAGLAGYDSLPNATHTAQVRIVAKNGAKSGLSTAGSFDIDRRTPADPFGVSFA